MGCAAAALPSRHANAGTERAQQGGHTHPPYPQQICFRGSLSPVFAVREGNFPAAGRRENLASQTHTDPTSKLKAMPWLCTIAAHPYPKGRASPSGLGESRCAPPTPNHIPLRGPTHASVYGETSPSPWTASVLGREVMHALHERIWVSGHAEVHVFSISSVLPTRLELTAESALCHLL